MSIYKSISNLENKQSQEPNLTITMQSASVTLDFPQAAPPAPFPLQRTRLLISQMEIIASSRYKQSQPGSPLPDDTSQSSKSCLQSAK